MITRTAVRNGDHWEITVTCPYDRSVTQLSNDQYRRYLLWLAGRGMIQDLLRDLSADVREQLQTGISPRKWDELFPDEDEE